jgi:hypothetical protein
MSCKGIHCDGCHGHGGGQAGAAAALVLFIALGVWREQHAITHGLEIAGYCLAAVAATALAATLAFFTARAVIRHRRRTASLGAPKRQEVTATVIRLTPRATSTPSKAIGPARPSTRLIRFIDRAASTERKQ